MEKCRHFNGYKPCHKNIDCGSSCSFFEITEQTILIVHLGAMGAVLRSTSLLHAIKRKYPLSSITWITEEATKPLLQNNPIIDRILTLSSRDLLVLSALRFDVGFFIDKSPEVGGIIKMVQPKIAYGFTVLPENGAIIPISKSSMELWEIGLNNQKKFFENKKSEIQLTAEMLELPYFKDEYIINLSSDEEELANVRRREWSDSGKKILIGLNTGTSGLLPNKTISTNSWLNIVKKLQEKLFLLNISYQIILLGGGKLDEIRNEEIFKNSFNETLTLSPTLSGIRDGLCSVKAIDMVITADSLGMHMAIAFKKYTVVWFGPTCSHEIDLFDRGVKIESLHSCSPCWKRKCLESVPCNSDVDIESIVEAVYSSPMIDSRIKKYESIDLIS